MLHHIPTYRSALSLIRGLLEYGNTSFRSFSLVLQNMLIFIHLSFDAICNNILWVEIISEGVSVYGCILRDIYWILTLFFLNFIKISQEEEWAFRFFSPNCAVDGFFYFICYVCSISKPKFMWIFLKTFFSRNRKLSEQLLLVVLH